MRLYLRVIPRSSQNRIEKICEGEYKAWLNAPPVDGKANEALVEIVAKHFGVSKSAVTIVGGKSARTKMVDVEL